MQRSVCESFNSQDIARRLVPTVEDFNMVFVIHAYLLPWLGISAIW